MSRRDRQDAVRRRRRASDAALVALVVAGLAADGETTVLDPFHVDRGYPDLAGQLQGLGADVRRVRPGGEGVGE
jgi:UDP-N-acetylglucosamine enolpyruvyl transferase